MHDTVNTAAETEGPSTGATTAARSFSQADLEPGDILLLAIKEYESDQAKFDAFMNSALATLKAEYDNAKPKVILAAAVPLIQISIAAFDGDRFSHAAIVCPPSSGQKEPTVVDMGPDGIHSTNLGAYLKAHKNPVAAVRYCKDSVQLGDPMLPSAPVAEIAHKLLAEKDIPYGYYNAFILAMLCVWRRSDGLIMAELKDLLKKMFGKEHDVAIDVFFVLCGPQLRDALIKLSHVAGDYLRNTSELVCSEMVAACFNDAKNPKDGHAYEISFTRKKPEAANDGGENQQSVGSFSAVEPAALHQAMQGLGALINEVRISPDLREPGLFFTAKGDAESKPGWWSNNLYTPADLSKSINTYPLGDWNRK